jgi:hypothetical protein
MKDKNNKIYLMSTFETIKISLILYSDSSIYVKGEGKQ